MRIFIALSVAVLSIASAAADQYSIVPYATAKPEGSQLETWWSVMVINESKPGLAYCQAVTRIYSGECAVSVKCRGQKLSGGSPPVGQVVAHGMPNEAVFQIGGPPPWWGIDQAGNLSFCCSNYNPPNTFACKSTPIPTEP